MKDKEVEVFNNGYQVAALFLQEVIKNYLIPIHKTVSENQELKKTITGFLINPDEIVVYIGRTHIAIEYIGSEILKDFNETPKLSFKMRWFDFSTKDCNLIEKIVGFTSNRPEQPSFPLIEYNTDYLWATSEGWSKLIDLRWNTIAQDSIMMFGAGMPFLEPNRFSRLVNGLFFDADASGLKTRHIKWLDCFPIDFDGSDELVDRFSMDLSILDTLSKIDINFVYPLPDDYKFQHLPRINRFIELWGTKNTSETEITNFLSNSDYEFILTMNFGAISIHAEKECIWQSEDRPAIRPDFFVVKANNRVDIVEFKLPNITSNMVVGRPNRETFAAFLQSYISQTRVYANYFDDPNNRKWVKEKYSLDIYKPRRTLIIGRRSDFSSSEWREIISDYHDVDILTFDDLIDGVVAQFYRH